MGAGSAPVSRARNVGASSVGPAAAATKPAVSPAPPGLRPSTSGVVKLMPGIAGSVAPTCQPDG